MGTRTPTNTSFKSYGAVDASAYVGQASVCVKWEAKAAGNNKGAGIQALDVIGMEPAGSGSIVLDQTLAALTWGVMGLEPETPYHVRVRMADGTWSEIVAATTTGGGAVVTPDPEPLGDFVMVPGGTEVSMTMPSVAGITYGLQYTTQLLPPTWIDVTSLDGTGADIVLEDLNPTDAQRFYRVIRK